MDGLECTSLIRSKYDPRYQSLGLPSPFIVACTANVTRENSTNCRMVGMNEFVSKVRN